MEDFSHIYISSPITSPIPEHLDIILNEEVEEAVPFIKASTMRVFIINKRGLIYGKDYYLSFPNKIIFVSTEEIEIGDKVAVIFEEENQNSVSAFDDFNILGNILSGSLSGSLSGGLSGSLSGDLTIKMEFPITDFELTKFPSNINSIYIEHNRQTYFNEYFTFDSETNMLSLNQNFVKTYLTHNQILRIIYNTFDLNGYKIRENINILPVHYDNKFVILKSKVHETAASNGIIFAPPKLVSQLLYLYDYDIVDKSTDYAKARFDISGGILSGDNLIDYILYYELDFDSSLNPIDVLPLSGDITNNFHPYAMSGESIVSGEILPRFDNIRDFEQPPNNLVENHFVGDYYNYIYRESLEVPIHRNSSLILNTWMNMASGTDKSYLTEWGDESGHISVVVDKLNRKMHMFYNFFDIDLRFFNSDMVVDNLIEFEPDEQLGRCVLIDILNSIHPTGKVAVGSSIIPTEIQYKDNGNVVVDLTGFNINGFWKALPVYNYKEIVFTSNDIHDNILNIEFGGVPIHIIDSNGFVIKPTKITLNREYKNLKIDFTGLNIEENTSWKILYITDDLKELVINYEDIENGKYTLYGGNVIVGLGIRTTHFSNDSCFELFKPSHLQYKGNIVNIDFSGFEFDYLLNRKYIKIYYLEQSLELQTAQYTINLENYIRDNIWVNYEILKDYLNIQFRINGYDEIPEITIGTKGFSIVNNRTFSILDLQRRKLPYHFSFDWYYLNNLLSEFPYVYAVNQEYNVQPVDFKSINKTSGVLEFPVHNYPNLGKNDWILVSQYFQQNFLGARKYHHIKTNCVSFPKTIKHALLTLTPWVYAYDNENNLFNVNFEVLDKDRIKVLSIIGNPTSSLTIIIVNYELPNKEDLSINECQHEFFDTFEISENDFVKRKLHNLQYFTPFNILFKVNIETDTLSNQYPSIKYVNLNNLDVDINSLIEIDSNHFVYNISEGSQIYEINHNLDTDIPFVYLIDSTYQSVSEIGAVVVDSNNISIDLTSISMIGNNQLIVLKPIDKFIKSVTSNSGTWIEVEHNLNVDYPIVYIKDSLNNVRTLNYVNEDWVRVDSNKGSFRAPSSVNNFDIIVVRDIFEKGHALTDNPEYNLSGTIFDEMYEISGGVTFKPDSIIYNSNTYELSTIYQPRELNHNLNTLLPLVYIYDHSNKLITNFTYRIIDRNTVELDLSNYSDIGEYGAWKFIVKSHINILNNELFLLSTFTMTDDTEVDISNIDYTHTSNFIAGRSYDNSQRETRLSQFKIYNYRRDIFELLYHSPGLVDNLNPIIEFATSSKKGLSKPLLQEVRDFPLADKDRVPSEKALRKKMLGLNPQITFQNGPSANRSNVGIFISNYITSIPDIALKQDEVEPNKYRMIESLENTQNIEFRGLTLSKTFLKATDNGEYINITATSEPELEIDDPNYQQCLIQGGTNLITKTINESEILTDGLEIADLPINAKITKVILNVIKRFDNSENLFSIGITDNPELITKKFRIYSWIGEIKKVPYSFTHIKNESTDIKTTNYQIKLFSNGLSPDSTGILNIDIFYELPNVEDSNIYLMGNNDKVEMVNIETETPKSLLFNFNLGQSNYSSAKYLSSIISQKHSDTDLYEFRTNIGTLQSIGMSTLINREFGSINNDKNDIYMFGGEVSKSTYTVANILTKVDETYNMTNEIHRSSMLKNKGSFIFGGGGKYENIDDVLILVSDDSVVEFKIETGVISNVGTLNIPTRQAASFVDPDSEIMYVVGGINEDVILNTVQRINIISGTIDQINPIVYPLVGSIGVNNNKLGIITGGLIKPDLKSTYQHLFDFSTSTWKQNNVRLISNQFNCGGTIL